MAVIKFHFPDWKGPTHHDVSPWWWIVFTNFDAFREGNEMLTNIVEMFLIDEVAGPKFPGPIPVCESFSPTAKVKSARERITNCSQQQLEALLPQTIVEHEHEGGGRRTCFSTDGLSQQVCHSQVLSEDVAFDGDFGECGEEDNVFAQSLTVGPQHSVEATPREKSIASLSELTSCLSQLNGDAQQQSTSEVEKLLALATNKTRTLLAQNGSQKRKINIEGVHTVAINMEANFQAPSRRFASSKNM
jgi:hypothetical protein